MPSARTRETNPARPPWSRSASEERIVRPSRSCARSVVGCDPVIGNRHRRRRNHRCRQPAAVVRPPQQHPVGDPTDEGVDAHRGDPGAVHRIAGDRAGRLAHDRADVDLVEDLGHDAREVHAPRSAATSTRPMSPSTSTRCTSALASTRETTASTSMRVISASMSTRVNRASTSTRAISASTSIRSRRAPTSTWARTAFRSTRSRTASTSMAPTISASGTRCTIAVTSRRSIDRVGDRGDQSRAKKSVVSVRRRACSTSASVPHRSRKAPKPTSDVAHDRDPAAEGDRPLRGDLHRLRRVERTLLGHERHPGGGPCQLAQEGGIVAVGGGRWRRSGPPRPGPPRPRCSRPRSRDPRLDG